MNEVAKSWREGRIGMSLSSISLIAMVAWGFYITHHLDGMSKFYSGSEGAEIPGYSRAALAFAQFHGLQVAVIIGLGCGMIPLLTWTDRLRAVRRVAWCVGVMGVLAGATLFAGMSPLFSIIDRMGSAT